MPECPVPFADQIPPNSAVICGVPSGQLYPKWCRIHCAHGYELKKMGLNSDHRFECGWDGEWRGLENGWPRCSSECKLCDNTVEVITRILPVSANE